MSRDHDPPISLTELDTALRSVAPAARLVAPRLLRRVVRLHTSLPGFGFRVPHGKTYVVPAAALLEIADRDEVGYAPGEILPNEVILLERPSAESLDSTPGGEMRLRYWELLFHARVHSAFSRLIAEGRFGPADLEARLDRVGGVELEEVRNVLRQERFLLPPYDDTTAYIEFVAVYLGIRYFKPYLMGSFFPALESLEAIDQIIAEDLDAGELLEATRLPGTPDPEELRKAALAAAEEADADPLGRFTDFHEGGAGHAQDKRWASGRARLEGRYQSWSARAERQSRRGNFAGAATRRARAEYWAPKERAAESATALREEVDRLVARVMFALGTEDADPRPWRESLLALAHQSPRGLWTVEARLLYDLQMMCNDHERKISTVDVMHWVLSLGRRPIRRHLPNQREVLMSRHLRSAQNRLPRARISERQRRQLSEVLDAAAATAETHLRDRLRPKLADTFDEVGLRPANLVENVSRKKLVEELLDRVVARGFLTLGDVRDAVSRNNLKLPDCDGPASFFRGDAVLRANKRLAVALDGVYEQGDFYLRWILRFSHVMFGTAVGRFITLYFAIPFGGAFIAIKGADHLAELIAGERTGLAPEGFHGPSYLPTVGLGIFVEMLMHLPAFRRLAWRGLCLIGRTLKFLLVDAPRRFFALPWVRFVLDSRVARFAFRYLVKPLVPTLVLWRFLPPSASWQKAVGLASMFVGLNLAINSRAGRVLEEVVLDALSESWQRFGVRPIVGLFWFTIDMFRRLLQLIERLLYTVDEWLRFRSGQGRTMLVVKGGLGVVWFFLAYLVRFCVNLLIEPQLNPLKHFPVVTVSHKFIAPALIASPLDGFLTAHMGATAGHLLFVGITLGTPGIFGFLVWELMGNWRLFAANRAKELKPVIIGSHGERMPRLLRPGFHSGTVPKRFAKLRRAERKAMQGGDPGRVRKHREALHHLENDLHRFLEREFIAWFAEDRRWTRPPPRLGEFHLATNRIVAHLHAPGAADGPLVLRFELAEGRLRADLVGRLCVDELPATAAAVFCAAILGLLKIGGVEQFSPAEDSDPPADIGGMKIAWQEWLAAWEGDGNSQSESPWKQLPLV